MSKLKQIKSSRGINREEAKEKGILTQYRGTVMDTKKQKAKDVKFNVTKDLEK